MKKAILTTSLIAGIIIGCGSSGSSSSSSNSVKGQFIDSPVEGLKYVSKDYNGKTDAQGKYICKSKESVAFYAGETKIGETTCSKLTTPLTLADNNETVAANIAYFIQNIDKDGNISNGIQIPNNIPALNIDFTKKEDIETALNNLGINPKISVDEAYNNLTAYLAQMNPNNENNNVNVDLNSYQCVISGTDQNSGFKYTKAISILKGNQYLQLDKDYCEINVPNPFKVKEVYAKMNLISYKDLSTGETANGYIEYFYPEGKVHYKGYSSKYGNVDCTAYFDVSKLDGYIASGDDIEEYYEFDDKENLKDKGNCPDWIFNEGNSQNSTLKEQTNITITDTNNETIEIQEYSSYTK